MRPPRRLAPARWGLAVAPLVVALGCATNPVTGDRELSLFSDEEEIALGAQAAPEVEKQLGGAYADPALAAYVEEVGQSLAAVGHRPKIPYHFTVLDSEVLNAFALPGGYVYVTRGLLARLDNEAQLAAVLGHEIGHVTARHGVRQLQRSMGIGALIGVAATAATLASGGSAPVAAAEKLARVAAHLATLRYGRADESQSDELGIDYAVAAGYNPSGMVQLLEVLEAAAGGSDSMEFLQSHPLHKNRLKDARHRIRKRYAETEAWPYYPDRYRLRVRLERPRPRPVPRGTPRR